MPNLVSITYEKTEGKLKIYLQGEIDIYSAPDFKEKLYSIIAQEEGLDVFIDCMKLTYIDSTGLGILVAVLKNVKENDKNVYIVNLKDNMKKLFYITGLDKVFIMEE